MTTAAQDSGLRCERLSELAPLREEWEALAARGDNVFATWEWASAWWRHHGRGRPLCLIGFRDQAGALVGILPLYLDARRPLRVLRIVGRELGDELGPVCAAADRGRVAAAVRPALRQLGIGWDVLAAESLPGDEAWKAFGRARTLSRIPNPVLEVNGQTWEDYMSSRSAKFRQQVRRTERRLSEDHGLGFRMTTETETLPADMDALIRLHGARWGEESSGVFAGADGELHREFAAAALEHGWLRLWLLELEGEPVAARLGYRFAGADCGYQSGRDPAWDKFGVGFLLQVHTIREAMNDGIAEYRFLRGGEGYKSRFASADRGLETVVLSRGPLGAAGVAVRRLSLAFATRRENKPWQG